MEEQPRNHTLTTWPLSTNEKLHALSLVKKKVPALSTRLIEEASTNPNITFPEDVLEAPTLRDVPLPQLSGLIFGIRSLSRTPKRDPLVLLEKRVPLPYQFQVLLGKNAQKQRRVTLQDRFENEVISGDFDESTGNLIRLYFAGFGPSQVRPLGLQNTNRLVSLLHNKNAHKLTTEAATEAHLSSPKDAKQVKILTSHLHFLQELTSPRRLFVKSTSAEPECKTNGCTSSPDFHFKHCCDAHDRAYCKGGTEEDRKKADVELYECIKKEANSYIAWMYYSAVRAFGASHFNYRYPIEVVSPVSGGAVTPASSKRCRVIVTLIRVCYQGDDIGNHWSWKFAVQGKEISRGEHKLGHNESDPVDQVVYDATGWTCGGDVLLDISAAAQEHDAGPDDSGSLVINDLSFQCRNVLYKLKHTVPVSEWLEGTALIEFHFEVELRCVSASL